jgi:broad specificity phosphatase PhoE
MGLRFKASKIAFFYKTISFSLLLYLALVIFVENRLSSFSQLTKNIRYAVTGEVASSQDQYWAREILNGGYILHFRHAERDKWIDVAMYDLLESNFNKYNTAEQEYFAEAVCLNNRGRIQAKAMGEIIRDVGLPVGKVFSSVSCRARQSALLTFSRYDSKHSILVHRGPYRENLGTHASNLKEFYLKLFNDQTSLKQDFPKRQNVVVVSHNSVISRKIFNNLFIFRSLDLEEGGFYVISNKDGNLFLEHKFHNFQDFARVFYLRKG